MLDTILKEHGGELLSAITGSSGLDAGQAEGLIPPALSGIGDALGSGELDLGSILGGQGISDVLGKLDVPGIAAAANLNQDQAQDGLSSLIPVVLSLLGDKAGGAEGLLSMLGGTAGGGGQGALGALGGIAGKLFGK